MATYNNIKKIKIGDNVFNLYDSGNSGGTVTGVKINGSTKSPSSGIVDIGTVLTSHQTAVTSLTTSAGAHTTKSSATGAVSIAIPTKTSHLTNDSGFITSYTDEKLALTDVTLNTVGGSRTLYHPVLGSGSYATIRQYDTGGFTYSGWLGTTSAQGFAILELGNSIAEGTDGNRRGTLEIYSSGTGKTALYSDSTTTRSVHLPDKEGTIALTSDLPTTTAVTPSITTTGGTLKTSSAYKCGSIVVLSISVLNSSAVAAGSNLFTGTLNTSSLLPVTYVTGGGYYGGYPLMVSIGTNGSIVVRNAHNTSITISGNNYATVTLTYLTN